MAKVNYLNSAECKSTNQFVRLWQQPLDMNVLLSHRTNICTYICSYIVPLAINICKTWFAPVISRNTGTNLLLTRHSQIYAHLYDDVPLPGCTKSILVSCTRSCICCRLAASTFKFPKSMEGPMEQNITSVSLLYSARVFDECDDIDLGRL